MANQVDIARALKDRDYFNSLTPEEQKMVQSSGGVGTGDVTDADLESVSGGLEGDAAVAVTTTSTVKTCQQCPGGSEQAVVCIC